MKRVVMVEEEEEMFVCLFDVLHHLATAVFFIYLLHLHEFAVAPKFPINGRNTHVIRCHVVPVPGKQVCRLSYQS